ncbi:MAG: hypothetical protein ACXABY_26545 [Candidatus Thorarchaeota archaeon]|jgi:hypothetical protein
MPACKDCTEHTGLDVRVNNVSDAVKETNGRLKWFIGILVLIGIAFGGFQGKLFFKVTDMDKAAAVTQTDVEHMKDDVSKIQKSMDSIEKSIVEALRNGRTRDGGTTDHP